MSVIRQCTFPMCSCEIGCDVDLMSVDAGLFFGTDVGASPDDWSLPEDSLYLDSDDDAREADFYESTQRSFATRLGR